MNVSNPILTGIAFVYSYMRESKKSTLKLFFRIHRSNYRELMYKIFILALIIFFSNKAFSEEEQKPDTCNYVLFDAFLYDYRFINSENTEKSGMNNQILTARPSIGMCFKIRQYLLRPNILFNPFNSSTEGSVLFGKEFNNAELGLLTSVNFSQKTTGESSKSYETLENSILIGPYLYLYPNWSETDSYEILFRIAYQYSLNQVTGNGYTTTISKRNGVNILVSILYATFLTENLAFSPYLNLIYSYSIDMVGGNIGINQFQIQFLPVSFRWYLN